MQTLNGEKQALWKAWRRKNQSEWQTALECRAIGQHWSNIKAIIKARRKAGEQITVAQWSEANAPVTHRWLDEFSGFADRWEEFRAAWKWAQTLPYLPERRPGLHGFVDLINTKAKLEHVRGERALHRSERNGPPNAGIDVKLKEPDARHAPQRGTLRLSLAGALASGEPSTCALPVLV